MDTKTAFEKHIRETYQYPQLEMEPDDSPCAGEYVDTLRQTEYEHWCKAWQASRAAIEIELPQRQSLCASGYGDGYFVPSDAGEGLEYDEVVEAITSHGIRIKGKTE